MNATVVHERASAATRPCEMYRDHGSSPPVRTQGHHIHPVFLQNRLWGRIRDNELIWLCGTCHDTWHAWLDWLLGEARMPPMPPHRLRLAAEGTFAWYQEQRAAQGQVRTDGGQSIPSLSAMLT